MDDTKYKERQVGIMKWTENKIKSKPKKAHKPLTFGNSKPYLESRRKEIIHKNRNQRNRKQRYNREDQESQSEALIVYLNRQTFRGKGFMKGSREGGKEGRKLEM